MDGGAPAASGRWRRAALCSGRGRYENWLNDALVRAEAGSGLRVLDVSEVASLAHVHHHDHLVMRTAGFAEATRADKALPYWMVDPRVRYEM